MRELHIREPSQFLAHGGRRIFAATEIGALRPSR
jgi:hypothetical protein